MMSSSSSEQRQHTYEEEEEEEDVVHTFEKVLTLNVDASNPAIISVRPSESLEIVSCSGKGRLFASVSEASSSEVVVEGAICFDSDAYTFQAQPVKLRHRLIDGATACALVEFHVDEHSETMTLDLKHTFHFKDNERQQD